MESRTGKTEKQASRVYRQIPNFNFIPPELQKPSISLLRILFRLLVILIVATELFFIWKFNQEISTHESAISSAQRQIQQTEAKIAVVSAEKELNNERIVLQDNWKVLTAKQADWSEILSAFLKSKPEGIELPVLRQNGDLISATGTASDYASLLHYRNILLECPAISQVISLNSSLVENSIDFSLSVRVKREESDS